MKKHLILAVITLAAMTFSAVSCQKEEASTNHPTTSSKQVYQPPQVEDMVAYLKDFKQKIQSRDGDETMTLDEAAWHLSSLANYDYGDVRKDFSDFHYDTLFCRINVSNGTVSLADMRTAYSSIANSVERFYQNTDLGDAAPRFIDVAIDGNGLVAVALMTSYKDRNWWNHTWFFPNVYYMDSVLNSLGVPLDTCFLTWSGFVNEQKRVLNILTSDGGQDEPFGRIAYINISVDSLMYNNYYDPLGSPFEDDRRILFYLGVPTMICYDEYAYTIGSYADLAINNMPNNKVIINWPELPLRIFYAPLRYSYQVPKIRYGQPVVIIDDPQQ